MYIAPYIICKELKTESKLKHPSVLAGNRTLNPRIMLLTMVTAWPHSLLEHNSSTPTQFHSTHTHTAPLHSHPHSSTPPTQLHSTHTHTHTALLHPHPPLCCLKLTVMNEIHIHIHTHTERKTLRTFGNIVVLFIPYTT